MNGVAFSNDPAFRPGRREKLETDTAVFSGVGRWNGAVGYTFEARATDRGEPGRGRDTILLVIRDARGAAVATIDGSLAGGNIQSLPLAQRWAERDARERDRR